MLDLIGMNVKSLRDESKLTVLHKQNGTWSQDEIDKLVYFLFTEIYSHPKHPEWLIVNGDFSIKVKRATFINDSFTINTVTGLDNPELPFIPNI